METVKQYFRNDRFAAQAGIEIAEVRPGYARARMAVVPDHLNAAGTVQGGALFTLADLTFAAASNAAGPRAVGVNMSISCLHAVRSGTLEAEAVEVARSRKLSTCTVRLYSTS